MENRSKEQQAIDDVFAMMEDAIRLNTYQADDLFSMVADLIPVNAVLAEAIAKHASDFIVDIRNWGEQESTTWTDIVVEAYRRSLFDIEYSALYGTSYFVTNLPAMKDFVTGYIRNATMGSDKPVMSAEESIAH